MGWRDGYRRRYYSATPIEVEDGIKAKSKKGDIGETWWSKQWVRVLESFGWSNRLARGRKYARKGQVIDFQLNSGKVTARVQGTRPTPYAVTIELTPFQKKDWDRVTKVMAEKAVFAAKLLAGEMPQNIEEAFKVVKFSLFPKSSRDIKTHCSCPDSANPCKHIAAVYYILAEEFDRDPFMLFKLRGCTKMEIITSLRKKRTTESKILSPKVRSGSKGITQKRPTAISIDDFWTGEKLEEFSVDVSPPEVPAAIIKQLGIPQFWDAKEDFKELMINYYKEISRCVIEAAYGDQREALKTKKKS
ncbi:MAG: SWIM zinc finger family protein [Candidatus Hodarchaeota archaeon]